MSSSSESHILKIENLCEQCENKELCPVYMGQSCLLVQEQIQSIFGENLNARTKPCMMLL